jgi:hypothetical protein
MVGVSFVAIPTKLLSLPLPIAPDAGRHIFHVFGRIKTTSVAALRYVEALNGRRRRMHETTVAASARLGVVRAGVAGSTPARGSGDPWGFRWAWRPISASRIAWT